jgi:hypothetical protein
MTIYFCSVVQVPVWVALTDLMPVTCHWMRVQIFSFLGNECIIPVGQFHDNTNIILKFLNDQCFLIKMALKIAVCFIHQEVTMRMGYVLEPVLTSHLTFVNNYII